MWDVNFRAHLHYCDAFGHVPYACTINVHCVNTAQSIKELPNSQKGACADHTIYLIFYCTYIKKKRINTEKGACTDHKCTRNSLHMSKNKAKKKSANRFIKKKMHVPFQTEMYVSAVMDVKWQVTYEWYSIAEMHVVFIAMN